MLPAILLYKVAITPILQIKKTSSKSESSTVSEPGQCRDRFKTGSGYPWARVLSSMLRDEKSSPSFVFLVVALSLCLSFLSGEMEAAGESGEPTHGTCSELTLGCAGRPSP